MYTPPNFNLQIDVWVSGRVPNDGAPDVSGIPAQFYVNSRVPAGVDRTTVDPVKQQLSFRVPDSWIGIVDLGCVIGSPDARPGASYYFRVIDRWKQHPGFPNHYLNTVVCYCDAAGNEIS